MSYAHLLRSASRGDARALEELLSRLAPAIYRYCLGMTGEPTHADEAMQETFVRLTRSLGRLPDDVDPELEAFRVARKVVSESRSAGALSLAWPMDALLAVPLEHREVLVLRELMGWDPESIARALDIPLAELRARLVSAREQVSRRRLAATNEVT